MNVDLVKTFKEKHTLNITERRPFDAKINENSIAGQLLNGNFDNTIQTMPHNNSTKTMEANKRTGEEPIPE